MRDLLATLERAWLLILAMVLAVYYVVLGCVVWGLPGALGIVGGLLVAAALLGGRSRRVAMVMLVAGTLPFAVATWWSVVTPLIALLLLILGGLAVRTTTGPTRA